MGCELIEGATAADGGIDPPDVWTSYGSSVNFWVPAFFWAPERRRRPTNVAFGSRLNGGLADRRPQGIESWPTWRRTTRVAGSIPSPVGVEERLRRAADELLLAAWPPSLIVPGI